MNHKRLPNDRGGQCEEHCEQNEEVIPIKSFETLYPGQNPEADEKDGDCPSAPNDALDGVSQPFR